MTTTPHIEAMAYRIWCYAAPRDWNVTRQQISDATGLTGGQISHTIREKGWGGRMGFNVEVRAVMARKASLNHMAYGHDFDENRLAVDELMA